MFSRLGKVMAAVVGCAFCSSAWTNKPLPPLDSEQIIGTWVGSNFGPSASDTFWRIVLTRDGKGSVAVSWEQSDYASVSTYLVTRFEIEGFSLRVETIPLSEAVPIHISGTTSLGGIDVVVKGGGNRSWRQEVHLEREELFESRLRALRKASEHINQGAEF